MPHRLSSFAKSVRILIAALAMGLAALVAAPASAQDCHGAPSATRLLVSVEGVRSDRGLITAVVYGPDRRRFLADNGELHSWSDPATRKATVMCLYLPSPGAYAVVVYHDANANGRLDMGPFGPREAYAFSNNVRPFISAPSLESVKFDAPEGDTTIHLRLRYP